MCDRQNNITLIGMPGAGKSTVGVVLAKILNKHFVDTDLVIQKSYGETLQNMIDKEGAEGFIARENNILSHLEADDTVIATGGSAVYSDEGMRHLSELGTMVYLRGTADEISDRIEDFSERGIVFRGGCPLSLDELLKQRGPLYEKYADVVIDIDGEGVTGIARKIVDRLEAL